jgi:hypothetical protein
VKVAHEFLSSSNIVLRNSNLGLRKNILRSVTETAKFEDTKWVVILEDDIDLHRLPNLHEVRKFDLVNLCSFPDSLETDKPVFQYNQLVEDTYFVCWGWMVRKELWLSYIEDKTTQWSLLSQYFSKVTHKLPIGVQILNNIIGRANTWAAEFSAYATAKEIRIGTCFPSLVSVQENNHSENVHISRSFEQNLDNSLLENQHTWLASKYTRKSLLAEKIIRGVHGIISISRKLI